MAFDGLMLVRGRGVLIVSNVPLLSRVTVLEGFRRSKMAERDDEKSEDL